ncbi:hypothetical protein R3P38DRAFT_2587220 [Favolaschia claudopus]|uniref:HNH nuclease domain-containing protein n=1 Tax=Favolaschia claudopus TaxID=2862362 RepID=A0AAV9Z4P5_9AGAR
MVNYRLYIDKSLPGLYLDVPVAVAVSRLLPVNTPCKYLRYLGYSIIGLNGVLTRRDPALEDDSDGSNEKNNVDDDEDIEQSASLNFYFTREGGGGDISYHAVDPAAFSTASATSAGSRESFREDLIGRDYACVFTNQHQGICEGTHIIPFSKGDVWLAQILETRLPVDEGETLSNLKSINDIRNGMLVSRAVHPLLEKKQMAVLRTPNPVLETTDVPEATNLNSHRYGNVLLSTNPRYTLQWLSGDEHERASVSNNADAAFRRGTWCSKM